MYFCDLSKGKWMLEKEVNTALLCRSVTCLSLASISLLSENGFGGLANDAQQHASHSSYCIRVTLVHERSRIDPVFEFSTLNVTSTNGKVCSAFSV